MFCQLGQLPTFMALTISTPNTSPNGNTRGGDEIGLHVKLILLLDNTGLFGAATVFVHELGTIGQPTVTL